MIIILFIILVCFLVYKYKNYFDKEYVIINIYDDRQIAIFNSYVNRNTQFYDVCVDTNIGDRNINLENNCGYLFAHRPGSFNVGSDINAEFGHKINFNDTNLNIEGYYTFENASFEDKNKNKLTIKFIKMHILKKENEVVDIKSIFDKFNQYTNQNKLLYFILDKHRDRVINFYQGNKENIHNEKIMSSFFHKETDMLWSLIKNVYLKDKFENSQIPINKILLHGPNGCGKSTFIYRMAIYLNKHIISINFKHLDRSQIYNMIFQNMITHIFLLENLDVILKDLQLLDLKNNRKHQHLKLIDLLGIIKNPLILKYPIATTTNYDEIVETFPEFIGPGRFKPIHFGYINSNTLQDISMHFFGKKIKGYVPEVIMIPTCDIIDLAFEALTVSKIPFDYFNDKLLKLL